MIADAEEGYPTQEHEALRRMLAVGNSLLHAYAMANNSTKEQVTPEEIVEACLDASQVLEQLVAFHDWATVFFFTGRAPMMGWIRSWMVDLLQEDVVEDIFDGPHGFYEILFRTSQARASVFHRVPLFLEGQLVHVVPWRPLHEYKEILKQACPIWVEVVDFLPMYWRLLLERLVRSWWNPIWSLTIAIAIVYLCYGTHWNINLDS